MTKFWGTVAIAAVLTSSAAHASIITFSGSIAPEGAVALDFRGEVNDVAGTGSVFVSYYINDPSSPGPIIGSETIAGTGSFAQGVGPFPPGGVYLDIKVADASTFELSATTNSRLSVSFVDPSRGLDLGDLAVLSSLSVSSVPLPSAAPLFGAGLVALGAAGLCARGRAFRVATKPQRIRHKLVSHVCRERRTPLSQG